MIQGFGNGTGAVAVPDVSFCTCLIPVAVTNWEEKEAPSVPGLPAPLELKAAGKLVHVSSPFSEGA